MSWTDYEITQTQNIRVIVSPVWVSQPPPNHIYLRLSISQLISNKKSKPRTLTILDPILQPNSLKTFSRYEDLCQSRPQLTRSQVPEVVNNSIDLNEKILTILELVYNPIYSELLKVTRTSVNLDLNLLRTARRCKSRTLMKLKLIFTSTQPNLAQPNPTQSG